MIHLVFELADPIDELDSFSGGHITLIGDRETVSSKDPGEYEMMIFVALDELLRGMKSFLATSQKSCMFESINNRPFAFEVNKTSLGQMRILYRQRMIGEASIQDFIQSLWQSAVAFMEPYQAILPDTDGIAKDLHMSMQEFEKIMAAYQPPVKKKPKPHRK